MQTPFSLDETTVKKILKSFVIALIGVAGSSGLYLVNELQDFLLNQSPVDWQTPIVMSASALVAWLGNSLREWASGEEPGMTKPEESQN